MIFCVSRETECSEKTAGPDSIYDGSTDEESGTSMLGSGERTSHVRCHLGLTNNIYGKGNYVKLIKCFLPKTLKSKIKINIYCRL